ncbi:MAG: bifunctional methylenetetrahydrofolate dehydrogenase/methenyltetrahydrofolate cyclohydrolase FolD [Chloroflexi bacterium]|nr:bifunctional methylenetetrahydrofolate dehydrogenase/methenyltetrahydrofolate cyclohydrolase FolD [Chloroflexota bacterium]
MTAKIIDGNKIAQQIRGEVAGEVAALKAKGIEPGLVVVLVGEDPASVVYVRNKEKACQEVGIKTTTTRLPATASEAEVLQIVKKLNEDPHVHGILVQLPLPKQVDENKVLNAISPRKDVDGFHPVNVGKLLVGEADFMPCTPAGIQQLLIRSGNDPNGRHVVVCGRSNIVGKPVAAILVQKQPGANATVTICHTGTKDMAAITRLADILVVASGRPNTVTAEMVKPGVVVIDVGVNRIEDASKKSGFRLVGDVDFEGVSQKASYITPVPGGVGPMTIAMLLANTVKAARLAAEK